jgi:predicted metal-dependent phosphoesterase TrpH
MFGIKSVIRIDLHTHSEASPDGGITPEQYAKLLESETLDVIAITDHDRVDFALGMQKALGHEYIIVGEEITTSDGEIIGLYLSSKVEPGMSAEDTADAIHAQNGLVYIPHPFEKIRKGLQAETLQNIMHKVDIIETINGRAFTKKHNAKSYTWATKHQKVSSASSDAHGVKGVGRTYTMIPNRPTRNTLLAELQNATLAHSRPPLRSYFYPKINRLRQKITGTN